MARLEINPLTRVEGQGRILLTLEKGQVTAVRAALLEDDRLFEQLVVGRDFREVPALVCRICSICTAVHRVAAAMALEQALAVDISEPARLIRELLLWGGHLESHALHLAALVYPDLQGADSLFDLLRAEDPTARGLLDLKGLGNRIQELAGGRKIHPVNVEVGGVLRRPTSAAFEGLDAELDSWEDRLPGLLQPFCVGSVYPPAAKVAGTFVRVATEENTPLWGEALVTASGERVPAFEYARYLAECSVPWSHAKQSAGPETPLLVGALARRGETGKEGQDWPAGIYANNVAQAGELGQALQRTREIIAQLRAVPECVPLMSEVSPGPGSGTALLEAPRGILIHHYVLDDLGRVGRADIVTPTAINQRAIEAQLLADLQLLPPGDDPAPVAERIVRAFDPCISCAVHLLRR